MARFGVMRSVLRGLVVVLVAATVLPVSVVVVVVADAAVSEPVAAEPVGLSTFAGSGSVGRADGTGTAASFDALVDLARSPDGAYLYALDNGSGGGRPNTVRKIDVATGAVTTFASGGMLVSPTTIDVDPSGQVWVSVTVSSGVKGIIRYPVGGGSPTLMVEGMTGGYYGGSGSAGNAFAIDPSGTFIYYNAAPSGWEAKLMRLALAELPAASSTGEVLGAPGTFTRSSVSDMAWDTRGDLYLIWSGSSPGELGSIPQLWRYDGAFTLVRGGYFVNQSRIVIGGGSSSAYLPCTERVVNEWDNGCRGQNILVRRSGFGAGDAVTMAGSVSGYADGNPGKMNDVTGLALMPDGQTMYIADRGNRRIRKAVLPPDPNVLGIEEILAGSNPGMIGFPCPCTSQPTAGDPVVLSVGNLTETKTDLVVPGRGVPLAVSRTYNSLRAGDDGLFGYGWSSNLDLAIEQVGSSITVRQENGSVLSFWETDLGTIEAPPRVTSTLSKEPSGSWTLVRNSTETITFDSSGRVSGFRDRNGYVTSVSYPSGSQIVMTDPGGRTLTFTVSGGHVTSVVDTASPGPRTVTYGYVGGELRTVTLFKMNAGDGTPSQWGYAYDGAHRMTGMTDPRGNSNVTHYDGVGSVDWQTDFEGKRTDFVYGGSGADTTTTVTYPSNDTSGARPVVLYEFTNLLMTAKVENPGSGEARWDYEYTPDLMQLAKLTGPTGSGTGAQVFVENTYDAFGNLATAKDVAGRVTSFTWSSLRQPLTVQTTRAWWRRAPTTRRATC